MPPAITREYRIPTDTPTAAVGDTAAPDVGAQLQAIVDDPTKVPDGTRLIFPTDKIYRDDKGLSFAGRKNFVVDWEGSKLTSPLDQTVGLTIKDGVLSDPQTIHPPGSPGYPTGYYSALLKTMVALPNFSQQVWYARSSGLPGGSRASRRDWNHTLLTAQHPFKAATGLTVQLISPQDRGRVMLNVAECDHGVINNYGCIGPNEQGGRADGASDVLFEAQHGIALAGCDDISIAAPDIGYVWGDCVATMRSVTGRSCSHLGISNYKFHHNGRSGITLKGITDWALLNGTMREIRHNCMNFEPNDSKGHCLRGVVRGGSWLAYRYGWFAANPYGTSGALAVLADLAVSDLTVGTIACGINPDDVRWGPISLDRMTATATSGNSFGYAIGVERVDGFRLRDSTLKLQAGRNMRGGKSTHCTGVDVGGNDFADGVGEWVNVP